jgi:hypothetical protein
MHKLRAEWEDAMRNTPPLSGVYPDYFAPIVRLREDRRVMRLVGYAVSQDQLTENPTAVRRTSGTPGTMIGTAISVWIGAASRQAHEAGIRWQWQRLVRTGRERRVDFFTGL